MTPHDARIFLQAYRSMVRRLISETLDPDQKQRILDGSHEDEKSHHFRTLDRIAGMGEEVGAISVKETIEDIVRADGAEGEENRSDWNKDTLTGFLSMCREEVVAYPSIAVLQRYGY